MRVAGCKSRDADCDREMRIAIARCGLQLVRCGLRASDKYLVAMVTKLPWQPQCYVNNSFVLSPIEVIFGMKLS